MFKWLLDHIVDWWMSRCAHPSEGVAADILEGEGKSELQLRWCRRCGAYGWASPDRAVHDWNWRRPRPLWCGKNQ